MKSDGGFPSGRGVRRAATIAFLLLLSSASRASSPTKATNSIPLTQLPPKIMREFRGAWIASNSNIDWPSKPGLSVEQQKQELRVLMDKAVELRLNALIL